MSLLGHAWGALSRCTGSEKLIFSDFRDDPEKTWHWRKRRCDFFAPGNRRAGCMTRGHGPRVGPPVAAKLRGRTAAGRLHSPYVAVCLPDRRLPQKWRGA
jgi:hypothetical protein